MKTNILKLLSLLFLSVLFVFSSCKKPDPDTQSAEDDARGSYIMADAFAASNDASGDDGKSFLVCPDVYRNNVDTVILTFNNCEFRGVTRNGVITVAYTINQTIGLRAVNMRVTFDNYTFGGKKLEGIITTSVGGALVGPTYTVKGANMKVTFADGKTISWNSDQTYTMVQGFATPGIDDNIIEISGTVDGVNREGESYSSVYEKVRIVRSCSSGYPVSGTVTITSDKGETIIDYGDGTCDSIITVTNEGISVEITL